MTNVIKLNPETAASPELFSVELEQQILGSILTDNEHVAAVAQAGGEEVFHDPAHRLIYGRVASLEREQILASPITMREWATQEPALDSLGGARYLVHLAGASVGTGLIQHYLEHAVELSARRRIMGAMEQAQRDILKGESSAAHISGTLEAVLAESETRSSVRPVSMMSAVTKAAGDAWKAHHGDVGDYVPTGIGPLDGFVTGFYPGDLVLLGGRPSMGKSALAINVALNAARRGQGVAFCSLEMQPEAIALRAMSEHMAVHGRGVSYRDIRGGQWDDLHHEAFVAATKEVADLPIFMLPRQYADIGALFAGAKRTRALLGGNLKLLIVDYVQLMRAAGRSSRYEIITEISTALKHLAGMLEVPVLALSQLSRQVEQRDDKRPQLSDLRESGQLEQDADSVLFAYRDEYYLERMRPDGSDMESMAAWESAMSRAHNRLEIIVAKQRHGPIGTAHVGCNVALNRIWEG